MFSFLGTKIVKGERRDKWKTKFSTFDYAEPHPVFCKDSERQGQRQMKNKIFNLTPVSQKRFDNKPTDAVLFRTFSQMLKNNLYYYISISY